MGNPAFDRHLLICGRFFLLVAVSLTLLGAVFAWSSMLGFMFAFLGAIPSLIAFACCTFALVWRGATVPLSGRRRWRVSAIALPLVLSLGVAAAAPALMSAGDSLSRMAILATHQQRYATIIEQVRRRGDANRTTGSYQEEGGIRFIVDAGPPLRVAFEPEGMLDNWSGIVLDPSGEVARYPVDPDRNIAAAPPEIVALFGGDLVACEPIWGDWYRCGFT